MSASPAQSQTEAPRLRRPSWKDPRLLIGILLVVLSVVAVTALVASLDRSTEVYVAKNDLTVGQPITTADLTVDRVRLGDAQGQYLAAGTEIPDGTVVTRFVPGGELVAQSATGHADALNRKPVSITVSDALPTAVATGARVEVWVSMPGERPNSYEKPTLLLPDAEISQKIESTAPLETAKQTTLMVLVEPEKMPAILEALTNDAKISVVWNPAG